MLFQVSSQIKAIAFQCIETNIMSVANIDLVTLWSC